MLSKRRTISPLKLLFVVLGMAFILASFFLAMNLPKDSFGQPSSIAMVLPFPSRTIDPIAALPHEFTLDGCNLLYLDMGTNMGVQIQKFYEPHRFLLKGIDTPIISHFNEAFGGPKRRRKPFKQSRVCVVGFEPNPQHTSHLMNLQKQYRDVGWNVWALTEIALGVRDTSMKLYISGNDGIKDGSSLSDLNNVFHRRHATADVAVIDTIKFVREYVAKREIDHDEETFVLAKMDIETSEFSLLRELTTTGMFCYLDKVMAEFHERMVPKGVGDINQVPISEKDYEVLIRFLWTSVENNCDRNFAFDRLTQLDDETFAKFMDPVQPPDLSV